MNMTVTYSTAAQSLVIAHGLFKVGMKVYQYYNRHQRMANKVISDTNVEVEQTMQCIMSTTPVEINDVTEVVVASAIDSVDNKVTNIRRKVRNYQKAPFRGYLVRIGKAKFGLLQRNEANRMCVRKYLYDACIEHGVLARHIVENVDFASELVFVPTKDDLTRFAISKSKTVIDARIVSDLLGHKSGDH